MTIVAVGGSLGEQLTSLAAVRVALEGAADAGATTELFDVRELDLPMYVPHETDVPPAARRFCESVYECVLCSHRVFSGLVIEGVPVRDWASLALICGDGIVGMGEDDGSGNVVMQQYRLRVNEQVTQDDFDEYLSEGSRFVATFRPFMHEYDRLDRLFGGSLVLACNTYVHGAAQDEWAAHLERNHLSPPGWERFLLSAGTVAKLGSQDQAQWTNGCESHAIVSTRHIITNVMRC